MLNVMQSAIRAAAQMGGLSEDTLLGGNQSREVVIWRDRAMATAKALKPALSLPQLGRACGGRHHTTVMSALRREAARMTLDPAEPEIMARLAARVRASAAMILTPEAAAGDGVSPGQAMSALDTEIARLELRLQALRTARAGLSGGTEPGEPHAPSS